MAELQSQTLNNVTLTTYVANADQIVRFVNGSVKELSGSIPDVNKLGISYVTAENGKKIALSYDGTEIGSLDASEFVKDGMVSSVQYDEESRALTIKWNADAGLSDKEISLSGLADSRVFIDDRISGVSGQSDLSVVKLGSEEYASMLSAGTVLSNCLYVVENRFTDMYGRQAKNMAAGTDLSDAVTLGQVRDGLADMSAYVDGSCEALSSGLTGWVDGQGYLVPEDVRISYDGEKKRIVLSSRDAVTSVDCEDFIKDGMISDVYYDEGSHTLSILWNSDGDSKVTEVNLSGLLDVYTAGNGLTCENGEFSLTADIPSKASDLENDSGYATSAYVDGSCEALSSELTGWVDGQKYLTEHQSLSDYYAKNETSSAAEIARALDGKQPSGDYATSAYVNEGHGYSFKEHFSVADLQGGGKAVSLSGVALESDVYLKGVFDECLSAVRQYGSPEEVPLSDVVNSVWCLSRLQS